MPVPVDPSESLAEAVCCDRRTKARSCQPNEHVMNIVGEV